jgi:hypothetical protein
MSKGSHVTQLDIEALLRRKMHTWEKDLLYIMRLTHSDDWFGATNNQKLTLSELDRAYVGPGIIPVWQRVSEDITNTMPGIYRRTDKIFVTLGSHGNFKIDNERQANDILKVAINKSLAWAVKIVTGKEICSPKFT